MERAREDENSLGTAATELRTYVVKRKQKWNRGFSRLRGEEGPRLGRSIKGLTRTRGRGRRSEGGRGEGRGGVPFLSAAGKRTRFQAAARLPFPA